MPIERIVFRTRAHSYWQRRPATSSTGAAGKDLEIQLRPPTAGTGTEVVQVQVQVQLSMTPLAIKNAACAVELAPQDYVPQWQYGVKRRLGITGSVGEADISLSVLPSVWVLTQPALRLYEH